MPWTEEERKQYMKEYRQKNKDKINQKNKEYRQKNKDKIEEYYQKNKDKLAQYRQTPQGKKTHRISQWKHQGIICDDFCALYDHFIKTSYCDACKVELTYDKYNTATTKCLDHDHTITDRPNFRNVLCNSCNVKRK